MVSWFAGVWLLSLSEKINTWLIFDKNLYADPIKKLDIHEHLNL
jgi:hypothetical protein